MQGFVYSGEMVPLEGNSLPNLKAINRFTGKPMVDSNYSGGDPGLQYRFWNQQEDSYSASDINQMEEEAFLGLENIFACRKQCKVDLGGHSSLRDCIRACKGKGLKKSALKTKEAETQEKLAEAMSKMAAPEEPQQKSNVMMWVVIGFMALVIIGLLIYFLTRKKEAVAECGMAM